MPTDAPPRKNRAEFLESARVKSLDVPPNGMLLEIAKRLDSAMKSDRIADVRRACAEFLVTASGFYRVPTCGIRVLAARPLRVRERGTFELFGDYDPETSVIRVWMRTAVRNGSHFVRHVREHTMPRILPSSRFPEVWICRLMAHTRLLRASRRALSSWEGNAAEEALLGAHEWRAVAHRLATDEPGCVITVSNGMRRILAILGSAIFLVIAPGIVAGCIPLADLPMACWSTVAGNLLLASLGNALYCGGSPSASGLLRSFGPPRSRYARTDLPHAAFGCQRVVSVRAKSHVCCSSVVDSWSRAVVRQCAGS